MPHGKGSSNAVYSTTPLAQVSRKATGANVPKPKITQPNVVAGESFAKPNGGHSRKG